MPWCDDCSKFWNPPELGEGATCPTCGRSLVTPGPKAAVGASPTGGTAAPAGAPGEAPPIEPPSDQPSDGERSRHPAAVAVEGTAEGEPANNGGAGTKTVPKGAPWHFKLLVVGVTVYMVYRIYWLIEWLPKHI